MKDVNMYHLVRKKGFKNIKFIKARLNMENREQFKLGTEKIKYFKQHEEETPTFFKISIINLVRTFFTSVFLVNQNSTRKKHRKRVQLTFD